MRTQQSIDELLRRFFFEPLVAERGFAAVDGEDDGERGGGLLLEEGNLLLLTIFEEAEVGPVEASDG